MGKGGEGGGTILSVMMAALLGGAVAVVAAMALLLIGAFGISSGMVPEKWKLQLAVISCVVGGLFGSGFAIRRVKGMGLLTGISVGAVFCLILLTVNLLCYGSAANGLETFAIPAGCMCGSLIAGLRGGKKGRKKRKRKS